jgi:hypothetical protein
MPIKDPTCVPNREYSGKPGYQKSQGSTGFYQIKDHLVIRKLTEYWLLEQSILALRKIQDISAIMQAGGLLAVRYHCGRWSEELNSRFLLLAYMVYL